MYFYYLRWNESQIAFLRKRRKYRVSIRVEMTKIIRITVDPELRSPELRASAEKLSNFGSQTRPWRRSCRSHEWSWHSRTLWRTKLCKGLVSVTQETTKQIASVVEFSPDFHKKQLSVRSRYHGAKTLHSLVLQHVIECRTKRYLQIRKFGDCIWAANFFPFRDRYVEISL